MFGSPKMLQKDFGGANQGQKICTTGLSGCDLHPSVQHISWQLYTRRITSLLLTLGTVYQPYLQTGGLESLTILLGRAGDGWHRFLTMEF